MDDENGLDDDGSKLRYAKNVDNPNEGVFVRCKGTLYRARKCPQVNCQRDDLFKQRASYYFKE